MSFCSMFFNLETAKSSKRKEQVVESSRLLGVGCSCLFPFVVTWQRLDKHRMVPPFFLSNMKKILLLITLSLPFGTINAQFKLTINGFVDQKEETKDYIVMEFANYAQDSLYNKIMKYILSTYRSPKDVISEIKPEMVTLNGFQPACISLSKVKKWNGQNWSNSGFYDMLYTITIRVKEGKIRIDAPTFECTMVESGGKKNRLVMYGSNGGFGSEVRVGLFKKNGMPASKNAIIMLEDFFNTFCEKLAASINSNNGDNDW